MRAPVDRLPVLVVWSWFVVVLAVVLSVVWDRWRGRQAARAELRRRRAVTLRETGQNTLDVWTRVGNASARK